MDRVINPREVNVNGTTVTGGEDEAAGDLRRGPWTVEEDLLLVNYITVHGEGRWNSLARCAGLKRTGKSCRLRWLNYLRPDLRRGNITPEEQLLILELHSRWGNRWSKIAQHLPGRTDNEIKNYWRTRVQKHAKQLKCDVNSQQFKDIMRYLWMPRLVERIRAASGTGPADPSTWQNTAGGPPVAPDVVDRWPMDCSGGEAGQVMMNPSPELSSTAEGSTTTSTDSAGMQFWSSPVTDQSLPSYDQCGVHQDRTEPNTCHDLTQPSQFGESWSESFPNLGVYDDLGFPDFEIGALGENLWSVDDLWYTQGL